jgi:modified peptide precursor CbpA
MKNIKEVIDMKKKAGKMKKSVIACRKKCKANGAGLSHYVLLEKENKS